MDFRFVSELLPARIDEVVALLQAPRLWVSPEDYPDLADWSQKVWHQIGTGEKRVIAGMDHDQVAAAIVYQRHPSGAIELKNLSVEPDVRGRYVASFLLRNAEIEGRDAFGATGVVCDAKASNQDVRRFLVRHGYCVVDRRDLYGLGAGDDLVYRKSLLIAAPRLG